MVGHQACVARHRLGRVADLAAADREAAAGAELVGVVMGGGGREAVGVGGGDFVEEQHRGAGGGAVDRAFELEQAGRGGIGAGPEGKAGRSAERHAAVVDLFLPVGHRGVGGVEQVGRAVGRQGDGAGRHQSPGMGLADLGKGDVALHAQEHALPEHRLDALGLRGQEGAFRKLHQGRAVTARHQIAFVDHLGADVPAQDDLVLPALDGETVEAHAAAQHRSPARGDEARIVQQRATQGGERELAHVERDGAVNGIAVLGVEQGVAVAGLELTRVLYERPGRAVGGLLPRPDHRQAVGGALQDQVVPIPGVERGAENVVALAGGHLRAALRPVLQPRGEPGDEALRLGQVGGLLGFLLIERPEVRLLRPDEPGCPGAARRGGVTGQGLHGPTIGPTAQGLRTEVWRPDGAHARLRVGHRKAGGPERVTSRAWLGRRRDIERPRGQPDRVLRGGEHQPGGKLDRGLERGGRDQGGLDRRHALGDGAEAWQDALLPQDQVVVGQGGLEPEGRQQAGFQRLEQTAGAARHFRLMTRPVGEGGEGERDRGVGGVARAGVGRAVLRAGRGRGLSRIEPGKRGAVDAEGEAAFVGQASRGDVGHRVLAEGHDDEPLPRRVVDSVERRIAAGGISFRAVARRQELGRDLVRRHLG